MHQSALILDAMLAYLQDAPREADGSLTAEGQANLEKIASLANDPEAMKELTAQNDKE
jgi:hypothetical protein